MLMVPPSLGAAPARRGAPAVRMPTAVPASTSRRVNRAPPAGTRAPASETNKAIILLLAAPLMEPCRKCIPGMRACQHLFFWRAPESSDGAFGRQMAAITPLGDPGGVGQCRKKGHELPLTSAEK